MSTNAHNSHNGELENNGNFDVVVLFTATSTEQFLQAALNSPSLSVDCNGPKWLKTGEGMFNNRLNTEQWQRATQH